jgi:hypothetical protein
MLRCSLRDSAAIRHREMLLAPKLSQQFQELNRVLCA